MPGIWRIWFVPTIVQWKQERVHFGWHFKKERQRLAYRRFTNQNRNIQLFVDSRRVSLLGFLGEVIRIRGWFEGNLKILFDISLNSGTFDTRFPKNKQVNLILISRKREASKSNTHFPKFTHVTLLKDESSQSWYRKIMGCIICRMSWGSF